MKEPCICEYCGHEFYKYLASSQKCCSESCAAHMRNNYSQKNKITTIPVDIYLNGKQAEEYQDLNEITAIASVISIEEYDDVYGIDDGVALLIGPRSLVYSEMNKRTNEIIILFECKHHTTYTKHRHHPDYNKPLEIELLCKHCHQSRHKAQRKRTFGNFNFTQKEAT